MRPHWVATPRPRARAGRIYGLDMNGLGLGPPFEQSVVKFVDRHAERPAARDRVCLPGAPTPFGGAAAGALRDREEPADLGEAPDDLYFVRRARTLAVDP